MPAASSTTAGPCSSSRRSWASWPNSLPFQYGPGCGVSLPQYSAGRQLEDYLQKKYSDLKPVAASTLQTAFVHCASSFCYVDPVTQSKSNMVQNRVALALLSDFVKESKVDPACFVDISPYKSNVELINRLRKKPESAALAGMADAVTVDSFQGQEGDIAVVVMGTTGRSGPGFTADEQRLNVIFSRQKNGLLVVGDIDAARSLGKDKKKKGKGKGTQMVTFGANGEAMYVRGDALRNMYEALVDVTIDSAFTNTAMRNLSVSDWNQLRAVLRHVPLCNPFWRVHASLGEEIWEGEWDTSIIPQVPLAEFDVDLLPLRQWMDGDVREQFGCAECSMPFLNAGQLVQHRRDCHNLLHSSHPAEEAHTDQDAANQGCWDAKHQNDKEGLTPLKN
ncbi:hypothetical protein NCS56_00625200 [Fusarium sp. Ph1]|nr:hypothetical protein NCS56_00625200 [Fusarium sp. Ph1]